MKSIHVGHVMSLSVLAEGNQVVIVDYSLCLGMGVPTVTAARILKGQLNGQSGEETLLEMEKFPFVSLAKVWVGYYCIILYDTLYWSCSDKAWEHKQGHSVHHVAAAMCQIHFLKTYIDFQSILTPKNIKKQQKLVNKANEVVNGGDLLCVEYWAKLLLIYCRQCPSTFPTPSSWPCVMSKWTSKSGAVVLCQEATEAFLPLGCGWGAG